MPFECSPLLGAAKRTQKPEARQVFTGWFDVEPIGRRNGMRSDTAQAILNGTWRAPYDALPNALRLRFGEYA